LQRADLIGSAWLARGDPRILILVAHTGGNFGFCRGNIEVRD